MATSATGARLPLSAPSTGALGPAGPQGPNPSGPPPQLGGGFAVDNGPGTVLGDQQRNAASHGGITNPVPTPDPNAYVPPDMSTYINQFNQSYGAQQGRIEAGLRASLGQLHGRRDEAAGIVAQMPAQVNSAYADASAQNAGARQVAGAGDSTIASKVAGEAQATNDQALASEKGAATGMTPYLNLGINANTQSGEAALNASAMNAQDALDQSRQQFLMQLAQTESQNKFSHDESVMQHKWDVADKKTAAKTATDLSPAREPALAQAGLTQKDVTSLRGSPEYLSWSTFISSGKANAQMVSNALSGNHNLLALLAAENPTFFKSGGYTSHPGDKVNQGGGNHLGPIYMNPVGGSEQSPFGYWGA